MRFIFQCAFLHLQFQGFSSSTSPRNWVCVTSTSPLVGGVWTCMRLLTMKLVSICCMRPGHRMGLAISWPHSHTSCSSLEERLQPLSWLHISHCREYCHSKIFQWSCLREILIYSAFINFSPFHTGTIGLPSKPCVSMDTPCVYLLSAWCHILNHLKTEA